MRVRAASAALLIVSSLLAGCDYTSGTEVTDAQARQFQIGVATPADVEAKLGKPTETSTTSDGSETLTYQYNNTHQDATNYLPVIGLVASHSEQSSHRTTFLFGPSGRLQSFTSGTGNSDLSQH